MAIYDTEHERIARWEDTLPPNIVDRLGEQKPDGVYSMWAAASGLRTITYRELANAVNGLAAWLVSQLGPGPGGPDPEVLTYIGGNDVRYVVLMLAAVKAGYVIFLTSPRNSLAAHRSLFDQLKCKTLVTSDPVPPPAQPVIDVIKPRHLTVPSVDELLAREYPLFAYDKDFQEGLQQPLMIIHTSGSTGTPKPVVYTNGVLRKHARNITCPKPEGSLPNLDTSSRGKRVITMLPLFHGAGIAQHIFNAVPFGTILISVGAAAIPTAQDIVNTLKQTPADVAMAVPSVIAELAQNPDLLDFCAARLEMIIYIGGALPEALGDRVAAKVRLHCLYGASEVGIPQQLVPPELDGQPGGWSYIRIHPCAGAVFDEVADGRYELVFRRLQPSADTQTAFDSVRHGNNAQLENEYRTKDLFTPHPTVPDAWRWCARVDDIIVFLNGEKTNPVAMEHHIVAANPELRGALVVGSQRIQAALLIEPASTATLTTAEQAALIERVWPSVEEANRSALAHARIDKALILVTPADKPPIRAGKGTLQRASNVAQYREEIDRLYAQADEMLDGDDKEEELPVPQTEAAGVADIIRKAVCALTGWATLGDDDGFFDRGMDSLQALRLTRVLRRALGRRQTDVALSTIYRHPTVKALTETVLLAQGHGGQGVNGADEDGDRLEIKSLLATYRQLIEEIPKPATKKPLPATEPTNVILTGSTGTVGTYLLHALLHNPTIGHIFCLNRRPDAATTQRSAFLNAGLLPASTSTNNDTDTFTNRVTFLQTDLSHPTFNLPPETYNTLLSRTTLLLHAAWPVNFNLPLTAFRSQLDGLVDLFKLAAAAEYHVKVVFISSVSTVARVTGPGAAPERVLGEEEGMDAAYPSGYGRGKFVAERVCEVAARHFGARSQGDGSGEGVVEGVEIVVARVGQVAGAVGRPGRWNTAEWFPSLVRSSAEMGCFPESLGAGMDEVNFVPVDVLADVLVELALAKGGKVANGGEAGRDGEEQHATVFNLRNPHSVRWATLLPSVVDVLGVAGAPGASTKGVEVVSPEAWLSRLQETTAKEGDSADLEATARRLPALKLLDFFREFWSAADVSRTPPMAIERALAASPTLKALGPVQSEWMRKWVTEWREAW